jgi:hypothetical protein
MTEIELKVREILYNDWNPCGVEGLPEDEYDKYVPWVAELLVRGDPHISLFLAVLQDYYFCGLGKSEAVLEEIETKLRNLKL